MVRNVASKFLDEMVETTLKQAGLWEQVKDDLKQSALALSGGQATATYVSLAQSP
jgi:phosphate transport system ATP-binding protein